MASSFASSPRRSKRKNGPLIIISSLLIFVLLYLVFILNSYTQIRQRQRDNKTSANAAKVQQKKPRIASSNKVSGRPDKSSQCTFRDYPKHRYYGLHEAPQPDFLRDAEYIYGQLPTILEVDTSRSSPKLCVNQTEWLTPSADNELPFADGTNPSILAFSRVPSFEHTHGATYLATVCMTNSLCSWKDSESDKKQYKISSQNEPDTVRTVLLWLNEDLQKVHESSVYLERNANWGRRNPTKKDSNGKFVLELKPLDDARLFVYGRDVWISFRDGKAFGYDKQVLNPIHFESDGNVVIKASESIPFCCGRNMALFQNEKSNALQSLTWVDPVTVVDVDVSRSSTAEKKRRLSMELHVASNDTTLLGQHRRLKQQKRESHIHGTNAFLVPYNSDELLGIGHFHRPPGRDPNEYSRHGHHYTHCFFTISPIDDKYELKRLSAEFVFPSKQYPTDADMIQFASGLELREGQAVIAYGINDCEAATAHLDLEVLETMLKPVESGQQVVDVMRKVETTTRRQQQ